MSKRQTLWLQVALLTLLFEGVTVILRFGMEWESTRDTASTVGLITGGLRIHHGYCGALLVIVAWSLSREWPRWSRWGLVLGWALLFSDLLHHFLILWPLTGSPQFDLFYLPG